MNVHASPIQRPSLVYDCVNADIHVLIVSNDNHDGDTSMHENMVSQHCYSNQSSDRLLTSNTFTKENMQSSTQGSQQVSDSQKTVSDTLLSSTTSSSSNESLSVIEGSQQVSINLPNSHDQSASNNTFNIGFKEKGFRIGHLNIQGLSNKIEQLKLLLQYENNLIHILGISETKLNEIHPIRPFEISAYQKPFRRDRTENAGGGLLVYVKEGVCCSRRLDLEHDRLECIWLEIKPINSRPFLVVIYTDHQILLCSGMNILKIL